MHQTSLAFLASRHLNRNKQNRLEGRNKGDVHTLSNCDTSCIHVHVFFDCARARRTGGTRPRVGHGHTPVPTSSQLQLLLLLKGKKAPDSIGNQCPMPVWLLGTTREKVEQRLCWGLCFLPRHCSRKVALKPDYWRLTACDDCSFHCVSCREHSQVGFFHGAGYQVCEV